MGIGWKKLHRSLVPCVRLDTLPSSLEQYYPSYE
ncbi:hypothetical protein HaLaN_17190 [Haematococcus lacustris]|uniref:Uncharacterized protein n=1 Tax=Haematococcus lacustris TaxID=44745 RepID=A0A699ZE42_HAELA|nr:hypothetical protein HaLaN_17190 [Haematococcus lacustris]